jgi:GGDEF domain-containing protein
VLAPFGNDELCVTLSRMTMEDAYELSQQVLRHLAEGLEDIWIHAGVVGCPEHGSDDGRMGAAISKTLKSAKRAGGSGIVVAH